MPTPKIAKALRDAGLRVKDEEGGSLIVYDDETPGRDYLVTEVSAVPPVCFLKTTGVPYRVVVDVDTVEEEGLHHTIWATGFDVYPDGRLEFTRNRMVVAIYPLGAWKAVFRCSELVSLSAKSEVTKEEMSAPPGGEPVRETGRKTALRKVKKGSGKSKRVS